jgi:Single-strand binding protein family
MSETERVTLVGNLTADPRAALHPHGLEVANLRIAVTPRTRQEDGSWTQGETSFHTITVWRDQATNAAETLTKGARVIVVGHPKPSPLRTPRRLHPLPRLPRGPLIGPRPASHQQSEALMDQPSAHASPSHGAASLLVAALEHTWQSIRSRHPEVPEAVLVVASGGEGKRLNLGHFAPHRWQVNGANRHEVLVGGEGLQRGPVDVLGTLLPEAAHGLAQARDVRDTSRQGRYHNRRYATLAGELGLEGGQHPADRLVRHHRPGHHRNRLRRPGRGTRRRAGPLAPPGAPQRPRHPLPQPTGRRLPAVLRRGRPQRPGPLTITRQLGTRPIVNLQLHLTDDTQLLAHGYIADGGLFAEVWWEHPIPGSPPNEGILWGTPEAMRRLAALATQAAIQAEEEACWQAHQAATTAPTEERVA